MAKRSERRPAKKRARRATDIPQAAEVVERNEYLVRLVRSEFVETKVFATSADIAQELAANGLGEVSERTLLVSETRSVSQIG